MDFLNKLRAFAASDSIEAELKANILHFVQAHDAQAFSSEIADEKGHVTAAAWILNREATKVLLVFGAKLGRWKLPGEHVETEDDLWNCAHKHALRALNSTYIESDGEIYALAQSEIPEYWNTPAHQHFEVIWRFVADEASELPPGARWFPLPEAALLEEQTIQRDRKSVV